MFRGCKVPKYLEAKKKIRNVHVFQVPDGRSISLHSAALQGNLDDLQFIIKNWPSVQIDQHDRRGITPLHYAARAGKKSSVEFLLLHNSNILLETANSYSNILHSAAQSGDKILLTFLMEEIKRQTSHETLLSLVTMKNKNGKLPVHCAAQSGDIETFELLFNMSNVTIQEKLHDGRMFHHLAAAHGHLSLVRLLYEREIIFESPTRNQQDIVYFAARSGNLPLVKFSLKILKRKHQNIVRWAPLLFAAARSFNTQVLEYLLSPEHALAINTVSPSKFRSPLSYAAQSGSLEMTELLIRHGAALKTSCTKPLLHFAAKGGSVEMMKYLIHSCKLEDQLFEVPSILGSYPKNIFHYAAKSGDAQVFQFLCEEILPHHSKLLNLIHCVGISPMEIACKKGNYSAVAYLIKNDYYPKNHDEFLLVAAKEKYMDILQLVLDSLYPIGSVHADRIRNTLPLLHYLSAWCENTEFIKSEIIEGRKFDVHLLHEGNSPLFIALQFANIPVVKMFLDDYPPQSGIEIENLLHGAALGGNLELTKLLIQRLPQVEQYKTKQLPFSLYGYIAPIHLAVISQNLALIKFLVEELGINVNSRNSANLTPLHLAACKQSCFTRSQMEIITYLILSSGYLSLTARVTTFHCVDGTNLSPHDVAPSKEIRSLLEKYSPNLVAERLLVDYNAVTIE